MRTKSSSQPAYTKTIILSYVKKGRQEISGYSELKFYPVGSIISYVNIHGELKRAGFLTKVTESYFVYISLDFTTKKKVHYQYVKRIYAGNVYCVKNDIVGLASYNKKPTKFPLIVNGILVNYFCSDFRRTLFCMSKKYKTLEKWVETFGHTCA